MVDIRSKRGFYQIPENKKELRSDSTFKFRLYNKMWSSVVDSAENAREKHGERTFKIDMHPFCVPLIWKKMTRKANPDRN